MGSFSKGKRRRIQFRQRTSRKKRLRRRTAEIKGWDRIEALGFLLPSLDWTGPVQNIPQSPAKIDDVAHQKLQELLA
ncbi:hypothetical protein M407DRAFT_34715 [Tulasnella calospora MUT 4182]|uniref:Uncharacterized protein n=1 Tax=Tulasnella calospora MUT 4182 TaxID=1051891 RepID=A0A0C3Q069_9AGAM|nr:hypothetical protein M407DRAFT_34715 [Tulasnella calospora MUT 4182]